MVCCINCFADTFLIDKIQGFNEIGDCEYCGSEDVNIIPIVELVVDFEKFMSIYGETTHGEHFHYEMHCPADYGDSLENLVQEDWNVFSDETNQNSLLFDILNYYCSPEDSYDSTNLYSKHIHSFSSYSSTDTWLDFANAIKTKNRYFPNVNILEYLKDLLSEKVISFNSTHTFYRAREGVHKINEMGPPPYSLSTHGRANPKGIPYLYVATNELTCIAEIRPWVGEIITLAKITPLSSIKVIDLSISTTIESPFLVKDLRNSVEALNLINQLSKELSKPVSPNDSYLEYIPTQFLAESIKQLGYDGLVYRSSLGNEKNVVFFDPQKIETTHVKQVKLNYVGYDYSDVK